MSVRINDTSISDIFQQMLPKIMETEKMLHIIEKLDDVGFQSIEVCEGSSFALSLRHLKEDPWERLTKIRNRINKTKIRMLLKTDSINGLKYLSKDVLKLYIENVGSHGVDIIRVSDPLNNYRNLEVVIDECRSQGISTEGTIYYAKSPNFSMEYFLKLARELDNMRVDSICIKDVAGELGPYEAYDLITALKNKFKIPLNIHIANTSEVDICTYIKAIEAGVDSIDSSLSIISERDHQSQLELLSDVLKGSKFEINANKTLLGEISQALYTLLKKDKKDQSTTDSEKKYYVQNNKTVKYVTKGMLANLSYLLEKLNCEQQLDVAIEEVIHIRKDLGYPPLVSPISQIIVVQAVLNVISEKRYLLVSDEMKKLINEQFGEFPLKNEVKDTILAGQSSKQNKIKVNHSLDNIKVLLANNLQKDEDLLTYAIYPSYAEEFFLYRKEQFACCEEERIKNTTKAVEQEDFLPNKQLTGDDNELIQVKHETLLASLMKENAMPSLLSIDG